MYRPKDSSLTPDTSDSESLLAQYDEAYAHDLQTRPPQKRRAPFQPPLTPRPRSWSVHTLLNRWNAAIAPYSSRIMWIVIPISRPVQASRSSNVILSETDVHIGSWPRRSPRYAIVLSVQPQGWSADDRRLWLAYWTYWAASNPHIPDERWFDFHHHHEHTLWSHIFYIRPDSQAESGWIWEPRRSFPPIGSQVDAANVQPIVESVENTMEHALNSINTRRPITLGKRWFRGPWSRGEDEQSVEVNLSLSRLWRSVDTSALFFTLGILFTGVAYAHKMPFPGWYNWIFAATLTLVYDRIKLLTWHHWFKQLQ